MPICTRNSVTPIVELKGGDFDRSTSVSEIEHVGKDGINNGVSPLRNGESIDGSAKSMLPPSSRQAWTAKVYQLVADKICSKTLRLKFDDNELERFYKLYSSRHKVVHFTSILVFNLCLSTVLIFTSTYNYSHSKIPSLIMAIVSCIIGCLSLALHRRSIITGAAVIALSYLLWLLLLLEIFVKLISQPLGSGEMVGDSTSWLLLLCYFTSVVLPARRLSRFIISIFVCAVHTAVVVIHCKLSTTCLSDYVLRNQVSVLHSALHVSYKA